MTILNIDIDIFYDKILDFSPAELLDFLEVYLFNLKFVNLLIFISMTDELCETYIDHASVKF